MCPRGKYSVSLLMQTKIDTRFPGIKSKRKVGKVENLVFLFPHKKDVGLAKSEQMMNAFFG